MYLLWCYTYSIILTRDAAMPDRPATQPGFFESDSVKLMPAALATSSLPVDAQAIVEGGGKESLVPGTL
jgi:hypothetical protein